MRRVYEHKNNLDPDCFTARYYLQKLVYFELCDNSYSAIIRKKQIKNMSRQEKIELVARNNPNLGIYTKTLGEGFRTSRNDKTKHLIAGLI